MNEYHLFVDIDYSICGSRTDIPRAIGKAPKAPSVPDYMHRRVRVRLHILARPVPNIQARLLARCIRERTLRVQCRRLALELVGLVRDQKVQRASDARKDWIDEVDDDVHGILDTEEDVAELAAEVHVQEIREKASKSVDVMGVRGQETESWDQLAVGVTAERDRVGRGVGVLKMPAKVATSILGTVRRNQLRGETEKSRRSKRIRMLIRRVRTYCVQGRRRPHHPP
jgi:hypothetical protein